VSDIDRKKYLKSPIKIFFFTLVLEEPSAMKNHVHSFDPQLFDVEEKRFRFEKLIEFI